MSLRYVGSLFLGALMVLCIASGSDAQPIRDLAQGEFRAKLPLAAEFDETEGITDFVVKGDHLYVVAFGNNATMFPADPADGAWRIFIYDISDRDNPRLASTAPIASQPGADFRLNTVEVRDDYLYTAGDHDDLFVVDITTPELPVIFVRSDALRDDLEDEFDIDILGFDLSEVKDVEYRKIIIEDRNMYVLFDFELDSDHPLFDNTPTSSVAVIGDIEGFPFRIKGRQTGTDRTATLLNNLADTNDDIKSFDYEDGRLLLGFDEELVVLDGSDPDDVELDDGGCGDFLDCLRDLVSGDSDDPYRDLTADGDLVYIVFEDGLLVTRVDQVDGGFDQTDIVDLNPGLSFIEGNGFESVFVDDDKVYLGDTNGSILVLNDADTTTPGVEGAIVNASSKPAVRMEEDFGDIFVATQDEGLYIVTAFGFSGGSSGGGGGCVARTSPGSLALAGALLAPLIGIAAWRRFRMG